MKALRWSSLLPRTYDAFFRSFRKLLPSQEAAIPIVLDGKNLFLIAPTGTGKTEAVVAPLAERALDFAGQTYALYIAPTRALANDLEMRLKEPLARCGLRLAIRHGERNTVPGKRPPNFILTTPESVEVMLSTLPEYAKERLQEVRAVIVDEAHQFFGTRRGLQLYCLLERLEKFAKKPLQRICLSATVAEPEVVARFFQGSSNMEIKVVPGQRQMRVRVDFIGCPSPEGFGEAAAHWLGEILANHRKVLVFANTRTQCDWLCWQLSERLSVPVFLHYSSLPRDYREFVEREFKRRPRAVCIATSTLELGIDIGDVDAVGMWGAPNTVSSFLQRLGRGNRRTDTNIVYAACPQYHPSGAEADPDNELLTFFALVHSAQVNELETHFLPEFYSVLLQQLLALCCQWGCVAPDVFTTTVHNKPAFVNEEVLVDIMNALVEQGVLHSDARRDLWLPTDRFYECQSRGLFWSNIGGQESAIVQDEEQSLPLAEIPRQYAVGLRPSKVVLFAGKPRLITRVEEQTIWVTDLQHEGAELAKYFAPPEPIPERVAQAIRDVLTMPTEQLKALPISCDNWSEQHLQEWRQRLMPKLQQAPLAKEWRAERWILYTFAGSKSNRLLCDWLNWEGRLSVDSDAWRLSCSQLLSSHMLQTLSRDKMHDMVEQSLNGYRRLLGPPPLFSLLPNQLKQREVLSLLETEHALRLAQELANFLS